MTHRVAFPVDALVSYHYYRGDTDMDRVTGPGQLRLIADSGAFSAYTQGQPITLAEYATWAARWREHFLWIAALDVIGNPDATHRNWLALRDVHGLATVPTLHSGTDLSWLDTYAAAGVDLVGLGGLVGVTRKSLPWIVAAFRYARANHPGLRFHLWGVSARRVVDAVPAWSVDSSGVIGLAYRYGRLRLFDPSTARDVQIELDGRTPHAHRRLLAAYGITPQQILKSTPANRDLLIKVTAASVQAYASWLQARHAVTPPASIAAKLDGAAGPQIHLAEMPKELERIVGPRVHVADTASDNLEDIWTGTG